MSVTQTHSNDQPCCSFCAYNGLSDEVALSEVDQNLLWEGSF